HGETSVGKSEDSIPVIEIRGEGKPMTAAQIRHLEEITNGGPLDIKASYPLRFGFLIERRATNVEKMLNTH
ncbi:hypothetical protein ANCDUO_27034, partial [Ancylostoma duodenale]